MRQAAALVAAWSLTSLAYAQQSLETIEVIGTTPLGAALDADRIASNVQTAVAEDIRTANTLTLADFMNRSFGSVFLNEAQNNPLQPDVQYRGFVGSPLLGLPQGIAVYQDGVRINEPFGDTVNWALIPDSAIDTVYLMPGSNPLFGLNALGGAISIRTKDGFAYPGTHAEVVTGSFARSAVDVESGAALTNDLGLFVTASHLTEDGWRDHSPTRASQLFANLGWRSHRSSVGASLTYADTDLIGNGAVPVELLAQRRSAIFTRPDQTRNELLLLNLKGAHRLSNRWSLTGNFYVRDSDVLTYNGDDSDFEECEGTPGFICEEDTHEEELMLDPRGEPIPAGPAVEGATVNRTRTEQDGIGMGLQLTRAADWRGHENAFVVGLAYDTSDIAFDASTELGSLDPTRQALPSGFLVGEAYTGLHANFTNTGIYFTDTLDLSERFSFSVSGRYNETRIRLRDQLGTSLNGDHRFERFNPAAGFTWRRTARTTWYASYAESNRAPSPVELTCADENDPCRLPNAFLADPPLADVVARTLEAGLRGAWEHGTWQAGLFRTQNEDDILFVSAGSLTNQGYFDNVGRTRRDGLEVALTGVAGTRWSWFANLTFLAATFRESFAVTSANHPLAVDGEIFVARGDRLPLVPSRLLKAGFSYAATERLRFDADLRANSHMYFRGDEANLAAPVDSYAILGLRAEWLVSDGLRMFITVDNALDSDYETFGLFGEADEVLGDAFGDGRFLGPGAPRAAWLGLRASF